MAGAARSATAPRTSIGFRLSRLAIVKVAGACLLLLVGTNCSRRVSPGQSFSSATRLFQQGKYQEARKQALSGYHEFQDQPHSEWFWRFRLLLAEIDLWNGDTKESERLLTDAPPAQYRESAIRYKILRSLWLYRAKRDQEAEAGLEEAAAQAHQRRAWELEAEADILLGARLAFLANTTRGEMVLRQALQIATDHRLAFHEMEALLNLGAIYYTRGLYGDAIPYYERADEVAKRIGVTGGVQSMAIENIASCYRDIGDVDRALKAQLEVLQAEDRAGVPVTRSNAYIDLGTIYLLKQDNARAIQCFRKGLDAVRVEDEPLQFVSSASKLAQALEMTGALDEAEQYNDQAFRLCDRRNKDQLAELTLNKAHVAEHRMQYQQAITYYGDALAVDVDTPALVWQAHAGLASAYARAGDRKQAYAHFEKALGIIEQNRSQLRTEYQITFLSYLIRFYQEYVELLMSEGAVTKALEVADESRASVLTQSLIGPAPAQSRNLVKAVQKIAARTGSVFLFYWLAPRRSYLWLITAYDIRALPLSGEEQIRSDIDSYRSLLIDEKRDALAGPSPLGGRLYDTLVAPAEASIPAGARVVIVPDGSLHRVNFEMLVNNKPHPHYWIEDAVISIAPSLGILRETAAGTAKQRSLLLIGDPEPTPGYTRLQQAALEMQDVERYFSGAEVTVYQGAKATVDAYRDARPQGYSTLHFAAHAEANEQSPLDSAIILSPVQNVYKLYARDVMQVPLTANLVTISACRGAGARTVSGEGSVGLAWAFFQAGARNVVTSLWDVNDRSSADMMNRFYSEVESGKPYATALRDAKLAIRSARSKPYFWAPFQLYTRVVSN